MASGIIQNSVSIAANTAVPDVLVNQILAFNRQGLSVVDWALVASATGLLVSIFTGVIQQAPEFAPSTANHFPIFPDDFGGRFGCLPADRIMVPARNTTGGALTLFWAFRFSNVNP